MAGTLDFDVDKSSDLLPTLSTFGHLKFSESSRGQKAERVMEDERGEKSESGRGGIIMDETGG